MRKEEFIGEVVSNVGNVLGGWSSLCVGLHVALGGYCVDNKQEARSHLAGHYCLCHDQMLPYTEYLAQSRYNIYL